MSRISSTCLIDHLNYLLTPSFRSVHSLSPKQSIARSHRPGLASIDNDNWEEEDSYQGRTEKRRPKRRGVANCHVERRRSPQQNRMSPHQKNRNKSNRAHVLSGKMNYGSTGQRENKSGYSTRSQTPGRGVDLNRTRRISNVRGNQYDSSSGESSEEEYSESDESNISSDFTR